MRENIKLRKARIEADYEQWKRDHAERYARFSEADIKDLEKMHKKNMKALLTLTDEEFEEYEEVERMLSAPDFDERAFEEALFGPYSEDDLYTADGYYIFADRYDETAKRRPPKAPEREAPVLAGPQVQAEPRGAVCTA